jgi:hypothetical protein
MGCNTKDLKVDGSNEHKGCGYMWLYVTLFINTFKKDCVAVYFLIRLSY